MQRSLLTSSVAKVCPVKTYAFAGASKRALDMYAAPILERFGESARIGGFFDTNPVRAAYLGRASAAPVFADFDEMLRQARPDCVIVTTIDRYHHEYIIRALEAGCDVITEKPMTIDDERCRAILAAEQRTGKRVTVTFNYRFMPYVTRVKELLVAGTIGDVLNVDFEWYLDRRHGADYFRRWHRRKENSGGLLVHKATHHFDLINWWLGDEPDHVFALGQRRFYGPTRAERGERCATCAFAGTCEFHVEYRDDEFMQAFYFAAEQHDGYMRDRCVFSEEIDIEDTMNVLARYRNGAQLSYSLVAYSPYEGWRSTLTGTKGRIELLEAESGPQAEEQHSTITVYSRDGQVQRHEIPKADGDHGGGDDRLRDRLFGAQELPDLLGHMAGSRAGAMSVLLGVAANQSIASGQAVRIDDLLQEPSRD
ncbi:MAG: gfo/Idh/MocA family oxidoreductase [Chloroflexi bacterium]|nr:gfo/Idh/MocA family oxidoreductase [Chloroflexota bacterium]